MRRWISMGLVAAAALLATLPAGAQDAPSPRGDARVEPVERLIERFDRLALTDQQRQRLRDIQARLEERNRPLLERLRAAGVSRDLDMRDMTPEQRQALRARMEELRPSLRQVQQNRAEALREVRAVLTPEQRAVLGAGGRALPRERARQQLRRRVERRLQERQEIPRRVEQRLRDRQPLRREGAPRPGGGAL